MIAVTLGVIFTVAVSLVVWASIEGGRRGCPTPKPNQKWKDEA